MSLHPKPPNMSPPRREKWDTCSFCGPKFRRAWIEFEACSVEPQEDETLTDDTDSATGVVENVDLRSGSYAGGDAAGQIELITITGEDEDEGTWGTATGTVTGSVGGSAILTITKAWWFDTGLMWPDSMLTKRDGRRYCDEHYAFKYDFEDEDEIVMEVGDIEDDIRSGDDD